MKSLINSSTTVMYDSGSIPIYNRYDGTSKYSSVSSDNLPLFDVCKNNTVLVEYNDFEPKEESFNKYKILGLINAPINEDLIFLTKLKSEEQENELHSIDSLYEYISPLLSAELFFKIDSLIKFFILFEFKLKLTIGLLTITHPKKDNLTERNNLIEYAKKISSKSNLSTNQIEQLLKGF